MHELRLCVLLVALPVAAVAVPLRVVVHTDFHLQPLDSKDQPCNPVNNTAEGCLGGYPASAALIRSLQAEVGENNTIVVSSVDAVSRLVTDVGYSVNYEAHERMGPDLVVLQDSKMMSQKGSVDNRRGVVAFLNQSRAPVVVTNAMYESEYFGMYSGLMHRDAVATASGLSVGFVALWGSGDFSPHSDLRLVLPAVIDRLRVTHKCTVVIALCLGDRFVTNEENELAQYDLDIVVGPTTYVGPGTHNASQVFLFKLTSRVNGTWIVPQTQEKVYETIHTLDFDYDSTSGIRVAPRVRDYMMSDIPDSLRTGQKYRADIEWLQAQVTMGLSTDFTVALSTKQMPDGSEWRLGRARNDPCRRRECELGNLAADAVLAHKRDQLGANVTMIGVVNGGAMREGWNAGPVNKSHVYSSFPFANYVCSFETTGVELYKMLERAVAPVASNGDYNASAPDKGGFPQVSGVRFTVDFSLPKLSRVTALSVYDPVVEAYLPISRRVTYTVATVSFLCDGGDGYDVQKSNVLKSSAEVNSIMIEQMRRGAAGSQTQASGLPLYTPYLDGRIEVESGGQTPALNFRDLQPSDCSGTERWLEDVLDCEPCPPGLVHPNFGSAPCVEPGDSNTVQWVLVGTLLSLLVLCGVCAFYCRRRSQSVAEELDTRIEATRRLRDANVVTRDLAHSVAAMNLTEVEYIYGEPEKPEYKNMYLAFQHIVNILHEFRAFLPHAVLAEANRRNSDQTLTHTIRSQPTTQNTGQLMTDGELRQPLLPQQQQQEIVSSTMWKGAPSLTISGEIGSAVPKSPHELDSPVEFSDITERLEVGKLRVKKATLLRVESMQVVGGRVDSSVLGSRVSSFLTSVLTAARKSDAVTLGVGGDSVLLGWNTHRYIRGSHRHCYLACRCGMSLKRAFSGEDMRWGAGIAAGSVLVGYSGSETQRAPVVVGRTVHCCHSLSELARRVDAKVLLTEQVHVALQLCRRDLEELLVSRPADCVQWPGGGEDRERCYELADEPTVGDDYVQAFNFLCKLNLRSARDLLVRHLIQTDSADAQACRMLKIALLLQERGADRRRGRRGKMMAYSRRYTGWEDLEGRASKVRLPDDLSDLESLPAMKVDTDMYRGTISGGVAQTLGGGWEARKLSSTMQDDCGALNLTMTTSPRRRRADGNTLRAELKGLEGGHSGSDPFAIRADTGASKLRHSRRLTGGIFGMKEVESEPDRGLSGLSKSGASKSGIGSGNPIVMADVFGEVDSIDSDAPAPAPAPAAAPAGGGGGGGGAAPAVAMDDVFGMVDSEDDDAGDADKGLDMADVFGEVQSDDDDDEKTTADVQPEPAAERQRAEKKQPPPPPLRRLYATFDGRKWHCSNKHLGSGRFGETWKAMGDDGALVAVKVLPWEVWGEEDEGLAEDQERLLQEVDLIRNLRHENLVALLGFGVSPAPSRRGGEIVVVMEYMSGGSVETLLTRFGAAPLSAASKYVADITAGLAFLHSRRVVHGNLQADTVLVTIRGQCRLSDVVGAATVVEGALHLPPETLGKGRSDTPVDVWSLGMLVCRLVTGKVQPCYPAHVETMPPEEFLEELAERRVSPTAPAMPASAADFVDACIRHDPAERLSAVRLQLHQFVKAPDSAAESQNESSKLQLSVTMPVLGGGKSWGHVPAPADSAAAGLNAAPPAPVLSATSSVDAPALLLTPASAAAGCAEDPLAVSEVLVPAPPAAELIRSLDTDEQLPEAVAQRAATAPRPVVHRPGRPPHVTDFMEPLKARCPLQPAHLPPTRIVRPQTCPLRSRFPPRPVPGVRNTPL
eukprot:TRINITY_DN5417_c0_g1_i1.p1 TRINITY_DN5417_c0_g1~~TRINITY_DN5417_c0_g1_i1.p1  ORF type:complete len:1813 (+),score=464.59 TRINITY_DN5417_c0_g1_i1:69-5441(+)